MNPSKQRRCCGVGVFLRICILQGMLLLSVPKCAEALGGEKAFYTTELFANVTNRQDFCERFDQFRAGKIELRDALRNMTLRPVMTISPFFNYDYETGINHVDPGMEPLLMDELAARAGFQWRNSFGVSNPEALDRSFTDLLVWSVNTYDIAVSWWDQSVERMSLGVAFIEPWFDGSVILVDRKEPLQVSNEINVWNWTLPFKAEVWIMTLITIVVSAAVFQWLEYMGNERDERSMTRWFRDNLYLSALNFTQNYEYAPNSSAGRIFGVAMGIWSLVMTATYTANLASLFVEYLQPPVVVESLDQAVRLGYPICTYANTNADILVQQRFADVKRVPRTTELETYQALRDGECQLTTAYKDNWEGYRGNRAYNPDCDLEWVGRTVEIIKSGFAVKADSGNFCTGFIRDVLNLHMTELISQGVLEELWKEHRSKSQDIDCDAEDPDAILLSGGRRDLVGTSESTISANGGSNSFTSTWFGTSKASRRKLKAAGRGAATSGDATSLSLRQMAGTFVLHYGMMLIAFIVTISTKSYEKWKARRSKGTEPKEEPIDRRAYLSQGPMVGASSRVNTFVVRNRSGRVLEYVPAASMRNLFEQSNSSMPTRSFRTNFEQSGRTLEQSGRTEDYENSERQGDRNGTSDPESRPTRSVTFSTRNVASIGADIPSTVFESSEEQSERETQQQELGQQLQTVTEMIQEMKRDMDSMRNDVDSVRKDEERTRRMLGAMALKLKAPRSIVEESVQ